METAKNRHHKVTSVDKANVLATSRLWRRTVTEMSKDYGEIELNHFYVDNCAMQLAINPKQNLPWRRPRTDIIRLHP